MSHTGSFLLAHELLAQALNLPEDAKILWISGVDERTCKVFVEHPDIPDNAKLLPRFHTTYHDPAVIFTEQIAETKLGSWGIDEPE